VAARKYGHEHFNAATFTAFTVNDFQFVTGEVDIHLVSGIMLDMAYDMCHHTVTHEIVAETGMSVSVRMGLAVLFVQSFHCYASAAKPGSILRKECLKLKLAL
jgi:hypothetical protein